MFDKSQIVFPMAVETTCPFCHKTHTIITDVCDYDSWQQGEPIQDVMPYLSADEREMLMTGTCPACWDEIFASFNDEEEDYPSYTMDDLDTGFDPYLGAYSDDC